MKLTTRYNSLILPLVIFLFIFSITGSFFLIRHTLQNQLDETLERTRHRIENYVNKNHTVPNVISFSDQLIYFTKINSPSPDTGSFSKTQYIAEQHKQHASRQLIFNLATQQQWYRVIVSQPLEGIHHLTILLSQIAVVTLFCLLVILLLLNRFVLRNIWQPFYLSLQKIKYFKVYENGELQLSSCKIDEFNLLNQHFQSAAENARKEYRHLKAFSENAAHETQTPLAIIRSNMEMLVQQEELSEKQMEFIQQTNLAVTKLSTMQQALLLLSKIDNQQFRDCCEIDVQSEVGNVLNEFRDFFEVNNLTVINDLQASVAMANKDLFHIMLTNLLSNAIRHNKDGGFVQVYTGEGQLKIVNTGIAQALDETLLFSRFYKGVSNSGQNGLGLSIVKEICNASSILIEYNHCEDLHRFTLSW